MIVLGRPTSAFGFELGGLRSIGAPLAEWGRGLGVGGALGATLIGRGITGRGAIGEPRRPPGRDEAGASVASSSSRFGSPLGAAFGSEMRSGGVGFSASLSDGIGNRGSSR